jgi:protein-tyrosine phosphatase
VTLTLPAPRTPGRYRVGLVCLGNICRSPVADVVLSAQVAQAGLADRVEVASCGTGPWHVGEPMDERSAATLAAAGYDPTRHVAQQYDAATWPERFDLLLAMDEQNLADLGGRGPRTALLREADPEVDAGSGSNGRTGAEVPDPYYGGPTGFEEVLAMVERSCATLTALLTELLADVEPGQRGGA